MSGQMTFAEQQDLSRRRKQIAAMAVIEDAKDDRAGSFYRYSEFQPFQRTLLRLFLPMGQDAKLFA